MRVLVTGIGIISPLAHGARATMARLLAGDRAIGRLQLFSVKDLRSDRAGEVEDLEVPAADPNRPWSRTDAMAALAAREALNEAGLSTLPAAELFVGGSTGGMFECETQLAALKKDVRAPGDHRVLVSHPLSATADRLHEALGPFVRTTAICSACSGGATAIALAANAIRRGRVRCALAGGVDALCRLTYSGFTALGAVDSEPCKPFDANRAGLSLGEGAAFLVLEPEDAVRARGHVAVAELAGWSVASEAHHITHPEPSGAVAAAVMRRAIEHAGLTTADIDYVNAHGTATPHNDAMETAAITACFGERTPDVWVSSIKGAIGHTLGAAGAIEAAITALVVADGAIPPTAGLETADPACALRHVRSMERTPVRAALSSSFGFGGTDAVLVLRPIDASDGAAVGLPHSPATIAITGAACVGPLGFHAGADLHLATQHLAPGPLPPDQPCDVPQGVLEMMRARRLDPASRLVTIVAQSALGATPSDAETGIVVGTAHGGVTATTHVVRRIFERGAKYASPVHFPCVLPSALASHPSIYLGLEGPALACSDLSTSGEAAFMIGHHLLRDGAVERVVVAAVDEHNEVAAKISGPVTCGVADRGARGEGAGALVLEPLERAAGRALAVVTWAEAWRGDPPPLAAPAPNTIVCVAHGSTAPLPGWENVAHHVIPDRAGDHESVGVIALVTAVAALHHDATVEHALVLGRGTDRGYAILLGKPPSEARVR